MATINTPVGVPPVGNVSANSAAALGSDTLANDGNVCLLATNTGGGARTLTFTGTKPCNLGDIHPASVTIPAGERRTIGPFAVSRWGRVVAIASADPSNVDLYIFRAA